MLCDNEYYMAGSALLMFFGWMVWYPLSIIGMAMLMFGFATID